MTSDRSPHPGVPRLATLTRVEAARLAPEHVLVLPLGSHEQHGPHLPFATDTLGVEAVLDAALARLEPGIPLVIAPTVPFGSSDHHLAYPGTLSLTSETYLAVLKDLLGSLVRGGFRRAFLLNGHGGNHELAELAGRDVALAEGIDVGIGTWWRIAAPPLAQLGVPNAGHAGAFETSLMLATRPDLVRVPVGTHDAGPPLVPGRALYRLERHGFWDAIDGVTDDPARADALLGEAYLEAAGREVAAALREFAVWTAAPVGHDQPHRPSKRGRP